MSEKNLENNQLNDDELMNVSGGKKTPDNLVYKGKDRPKASNTLYSGQSHQAGNLLYKDESDNKTIIDGITFNDGPRLC